MDKHARMDKPLVDKPIVDKPRDPVYPAPAREESIQKNWHEVRWKLVQTRMDQGLSQSDLGNLCGLGQGTVSRIERGRSTPNADTLCRLAAVLGYKLSLTPVGQAPVPNDSLVDWTSPKGAIYHDLID